MMTNPTCTCCDGPEPEGGWYKPSVNERFCSINCLVRHEDMLCNCFGDCDDAPDPDEDDF